jgi:hypothetical protein
MNKGFREILQEKMAAQNAASSVKDSFASDAADFGDYSTSRAKQPREQSRAKAADTTFAFAWETPAAKGTSRHSARVQSYASTKSYASSQSYASSKDYASFQNTTQAQSFARAQSAADARNSARAEDTTSAESAHGQANSIGAGTAHTRSPREKVIAAARLTSTELAALNVLIELGAKELTTALTRSQVKKAFRRLAKQLHPDSFAPSGSAKTSGDAKTSSTAQTRAPATSGTARHHAPVSSAQFIRCKQAYDVLLSAKAFDTESASESESPLQAAS